MILRQLHHNDIGLYSKVQRQDAAGATKHYSEKELQCAAVCKYGHPVP